MEKKDFDMQIGNFFEIVKSNYTTIQNFGGGLRGPNNFAHLDFVVKGRNIITIDKKPYIAEEDTIIYIPKNTVYTSVCKNTMWEYYSFLFEYNNDDEFSKLPLPIIFKPKNPKHYLDLYKINHKLSIVQPYGYKLKIKKNIFDVVDKIADEYLISSNDRYVIRKSSEYLESNYNSPDLNLSTIADLSGITPAHFRKLFKNIYGMTPVKYINKLRLNEAKSLLSNTNLSIEQIAYKCGFTDYSYFARVFSKTLGIAPTQYREKNRTLPY